MRYYKQIDNDYILAVGTGSGGEEITQEEYDHILSVIRSVPVAENGYMYKLRTDLTWDLAEAPERTVDDDEITAEEALTIILGGAD